MKALIFAAGFALMSAVSVQAATVTNLGDGQDAYDLVDTSAGTDLAAGLTFDAMTRTGSVGVSRSPYDNSGSAGVAGFENLSYFSVGPDNEPSPATLTITGGANTLNFLWGSIDGYNSIALYDGGSLLDTISNTDISPSSSESAGVGASYVSIFSNARFDRAEFRSTSNAFEVANISVSAIPLPAGALLMLTALGGLGVASRRRKAAS
ncbi:MAG: VPLPA-CTERM sorting domain-containing protein [Pseudomonadota bacterium]|uniref:VPLPA-CTERM sorting domain-containing protein n=1 Tax=Roseovarius TaxID=74030 RepID=UPI0022A8121C|nr:VPLPA-CTERM sorting domain-containing protein [Roseovarius sp. EGI FJ00037]MCZ0813035.1 VPLPA-CTERM sorting domain-containing protein [Roseovarius sp. EGI FJ00037]